MLALRMQRAAVWRCCSPRHAVRLESVAAAKKATREVAEKRCVWDRQVLCALRKVRSHFYAQQAPFRSFCGLRDEAGRLHAGVRHALPPNANSLALQGLLDAAARALQRVGGQAQRFLDHGLACGERSRRSSAHSRRVRPSRIPQLLRVPDRYALIGMPPHQVNADPPHLNRRRLSKLGRWGAGRHRGKANALGD